MENTENKSLKSFFLSNKKKLFLLIGVIFFSLIYFWWADHTKKKDRYKNSEDFIAAKIFLSNNENQKSLEVLKKIISTNDEVYSPLSLFMIIDRNLEENRENVLKFYVGSIARKITRTATCSVLLLIKPSIEEIPSKHVVVNSLNEPNTEKTIRAAFEFSFLMNIPNITLVGEISQSKVNVTADDDESLKKVTEIKEGIENEEKNRYDEILFNIPDSLKENKKIQSQSIFGARGYSIGHYARVVRADLLVLNSKRKHSSFISRIFPKDLEHVLSELPTDVLIIKN